MAAITVAALAFVLFTGRALGFYYDEWDFVLQRLGSDPETFLRPHNEHISVVPVLVYKTLFAVVGLEHHWPFRAVLALAYVACGVAVFVLVRRRLGPWPGVVLATLILFMGLGHQNMVHAFQIGFVG